MLVLSRKKDEGIVLEFDDRKVMIRIVDVLGKNKVRVGIDAPPEVIILREELLQEKVAV